MPTRDSRGIALAVVVLFIGALIAGVPGKADTHRPAPAPATTTSSTVHSADR